LAGPELLEQIISLGVVHVVLLDVAWRPGVAMSRGHCRHHDWLSLDSFAGDVALFLIGEPISGYYYRGIGSPEAAAAEQVTDALPVAFARRPLFARFARRRSRHF